MNLNDEPRRTTPHPFFWWGEGGLTMLHSKLSSFRNIKKIFSMVEPRQGREEIVPACLNNC